MRRTHILCVAVAVAVAVVAGAALCTNSAMARDCYRIVDIRALGFIPNPAIITFGINDQHEAVFTAVVGTKKHAFLWLPAPAYNLTEGFHDLHTLAGFSAFTESAVYEINNAGIAVGWTDDSGAQHALVWEINEYDDQSSPPLPTIDLADFTVFGPWLSTGNVGRWRRT